MPMQSKQAPPTKQPQAPKSATATPKPAPGTTPKPQAPGFSGLLASKVSAAKQPDNTCPADPPPLPRAVVLEQLAHKYAYKDSFSPEDHNWLAAQGYHASDPIHGEFGFAMVNFTPLPERRGDLAPIVAFRGSDKIVGKDGLDDLNPAGIGLHQYSMNEGVIAESLQFAAAMGRVEVVGHSLGGALAQLAAVAYPSFVRHIATFQSPGIGNANAQTLKDYNKSAQQPIEADHHRVKGDVVSKGGEAFAPGTTTEYAVDVGDNGKLDDAEARHLTYPVTREFQQKNPGHHAGLEGGAAGNVQSSESKCTTNDKGNPKAEAGRVAAGAMLAPWTADMLAADKLWIAFRNDLMSGIPVDTLLARVDTAPILSKAQKATMRANLKKLAGVRLREQSDPGGGKIKRQLDKMVPPKKVTTVQ